MPHTAPSEDEIIRLFETGQLWQEITRHHAEDDESEDSFVRRCIRLHNKSRIDLLGLASEERLLQTPTHQFFTAQHFYCNAIPELHATVGAVMQCCLDLVTKAGNDLASNLPNAAFRQWCLNNSDGTNAVIAAARTGDDLAKKFVTFALEALGDTAVALSFVSDFFDDRRLSGMTALGRMKFADHAAAQIALTALAPHVGQGDENTRNNALLASFRILESHNDAVLAYQLVIDATTIATPMLLMGLAMVLSNHQAQLSDNSIRSILNALLHVPHEHNGTIKQIDQGLRKLLKTHTNLAVDYLTQKLADANFTIEDFPSTRHRLVHENSEVLQSVLVSWLLVGTVKLCNNLSKLLPDDEKAPLSIDFQKYSLTSSQRIFICHKAIGFLFIDAVACCSIIVSLLRTSDRESAGELVNLLVDPMLRNYGGNSLDYLKSIEKSDPAYNAVRRALRRNDQHIAGLNAVGEIKELHPSTHNRNLVDQRQFDQMHAAQKQAESQSIFADLVHRSVLLYGKKSLTYVNDPSGERRELELDLKSITVSVEVPRGQTLDPVGLEYMLRVFRAEKPT
ncbi:MAG: hypothetical protein ACK4NA_03015 [Alphaproteobacteria bacterium]